MKIAIMQPYIFPYIGYFQLIADVDKFVVLDDVNFINKGWINRNRILINGKDNLFTIPLEKSSQNKLINEIEISNEIKWKIKFIKSIELSYKKAPYYKNIFPLIEYIINSDKNKISEFNLNCIKVLNDHFDINTTIVPSSSVYNNKELKADDRILDICLKENVRTYINPIGGIELYNKDKFKESGVDLYFIKTNSIQYKQFENPFVPWLSIIDVMMFNSTTRIKEYLNSSYQLI